MGNELRSAEGSQNTGVRAIWELWLSVIGVKRGALRGGGSGVWEWKPHEHSRHSRITPTPSFPLQRFSIVGQIEEELFDMCRRIVNGNSRV